MSADVDLFDEAGLAGMIDSLGEETVVTVLRKLAVNASETATRISAHQWLNDVDAAKKEGHSLKGAAAMACARRLEALARSIERDNPLDQELPLRIEACAREMQSYLADRFA